MAALGPVLHRWLPRYPGRDWPWQFERADLLARVVDLESTIARERSEALRLLRGSGQSAESDPQNPKAAASHWISRRLDQPFIKGEGVGWKIYLTFDPLLASLESLCDDINNLFRSPLRLLEDGRPLGPAHAPHRRIGEDGGGAYSHWTGNTLWFSTSDNSDPNSNARDYSIEWLIPK